MERVIKLRVVTPQGLLLETKCDSLVMPAADGGLIGVRYGHTKAIIALSNGKIKATLGGRIIAETSVPGGYARIDKDEAVIITEGVAPDNGRADA